MSSDIREGLEIRNGDMNSPTRIRFLDQEMAVVSHASSPDGTVHLTCQAETIPSEVVRLFEGDSPLGNARITGLTVNLVVEPETAL
jgi:hypothetical protein